MDPMGEEQLDYGDEEYGGSQKMQFQDGRAAIPALAEEEMMAEDEDYDDLYNDVNVGESFFQTLQKPSEPPPGPPIGNGRHEAAFPGAGGEEQDSRAEQKTPGGFPVPTKGLEEGSGDYAEGIRVSEVPPGNLGFQGAPPAPIPMVTTHPPSSIPPDLGIRTPAPPNRAAGLVGSRPVMNDSSRPAMGAVENNGQTMLFVGELHWWTTDAEIESVLSQYGRVKEIRFFDERASGKSKGYCQVEFYDSGAAAACKEGMNGHMFNGRACVVTFASPQSMRQMNAAYMNKTQPQQPQSQMQGGRRPMMNEGIGRGGGTNFQGGNDGGRNFGRGGWGRGGQGFNNRGPMRGRGVMGAKSMVGASGGVGTGGAGNPYGQGFAGPGLGGPAGGMMHPQGMMGAGFDPTYMGRGGPYGGFSATGFAGMMPSFQAVNTIGLPGVAPHVNPAFFGRGMTTNGMGMMGSNGMENAGMWADTSMGGWGVEEHGRRTRESSYGGDDGASDYGYGEANQERGGRSNASREKERGSEREWSGNSERRHRDEKDRDWDNRERERQREEKDGHRQRDRDWDNDDNYDRGQSSTRSRSKSQMMQEEDHRSRSRDADYGKRRRIPSE